MAVAQTPARHQTQALPSKILKQYTINNQNQQPKSTSQSPLNTKPHGHDKKQVKFQSKP
jgi:hypothetical protein